MIDGDKFDSLIVDLLNDRSVSIDAQEQFVSCFGIEKLRRLFLRVIVPSSILSDEVLSDILRYWQLFLKSYLEINEDHGLNEVPTGLTVLLLKPNGVQTGHYRWFLGDLVEAYSIN